MCNIEFSKRFFYRQNKNTFTLYGEVLGLFFLRFLAWPEITYLHSYLQTCVRGQVPWLPSYFLYTATRKVGQLRGNVWMSELVSELGLPVCNLISGHPTSKSSTSSYPTLAGPLLIKAVGNNGVNPGMCSELACPRATRARGRKFVYFYRRVKWKDVWFLIAHQPVSIIGLSDFLFSFLFLYFHYLRGKGITRLLLLFLA